MIQLKNITLRNFLSIGQVTQAVNVQPIGIGIAADPINKPGTKTKDKVSLTADEEIKRALDAKQSIVAGELFNTIYTNEILDTAGALVLCVEP